MESIISPTPKVLRLNPRLFIALGAFLLLLVLLFIYLMHHYAPKPMVRTAEQIIVDDTAAVEAIRDYPPLKLKAVTPVITTTIEDPNASSILVDAGNAPIVVFRGERKLKARVETLHTKSNGNACCSIPAVTLIPAILETGINSDLPGTILARVRQAVMGGPAHDIVLIPQGALIIGKYDAHIIPGQNRIQIVWHRIILPNGKALNLNHAPGIDNTGATGLTDTVDNHTFKIFGHSILYSALSAGAQLSQVPHAGDNVSASQTAFSAAGQQIAQTGSQLVARNLKIQPTITIRPGTQFNVLLTQDLFIKVGRHDKS